MEEDQERKGEKWTNEEIVTVFMKLKDEQKRDAEKRREISERRKIKKR